MNTGDQSALVDGLRAQMTALAQQFERAMIAEAERVLRVLIRQAQESQRRRGTHLERIRAVLQQAGGQELSATQIADQAQIEPGAARLVLYANPNLFEPLRRSVRRVVWRLRGQSPVSDSTLTEPTSAERGLAVVY